MQDLHSQDYDPIALFTDVFATSERGCNSAFWGSAADRVHHMLHRNGWPGVYWSLHPAGYRLDSQEAQLVSF